ncbi:hypothetical protein MesoLj113a_21670 [Mesorhizobium sp. 113-1-2]|nr:hypothetical protein MesoLj113a_21670 [Mesorhizobium sp. 113-1-2]
MNMTTIIASLSNNQQQAASSCFRVDISLGERIGRVSSEWFSRPDDERYLSLTELFNAVKQRAHHATALKKLGLPAICLETQHVRAVCAA